ncbi:hypothetical protein ACOZ4N_00610 (plasmid) [Halorientalis pallida]|uniref:hypothetical protein n=1 Tax=Halorientalis pallida TaxID=2479928 RepID=UPI003C6F3A2D
MVDDDPAEHILDEALLRTVARRLGDLTLVETVSVFPASYPESVVALFDDSYYPTRMDQVSLELRAYVDGAFYITYREEWNGQARMCRWDRHENPHNTRDHFHQPPNAETKDAVDREYPNDFMRMLEQVLEYVDDRVGAVWDQDL